MDKSTDRERLVHEVMGLLPEFGSRLADVEPDAKYSSEWYARVGAFWRERREEAGFSRAKVADILERSETLIRFFELGWTPKSLTPEFVIAYAEAVSADDIYADFCANYQFP